MSTSEDDEQFRNIGREMLRMIHAVRSHGGEHGIATAHARRTFTFPGGEVYLFIARANELASGILLLHVFLQEGKLRPPRE